MASAYSKKEIHLTFSPVELRCLADEMERKWTVLNVGGDTVVEAIKVDYTNPFSDTMVLIHLDQMYFHKLKKEEDLKEFRHNVLEKQKIHSKVTCTTTAHTCPLHGHHKAKPEFCSILHKYRPCTQGEPCAIHVEEK